MSIPVDESAVFPDFTDDQLNRLRGYGTVRPVLAGEILFSPDDDSHDLPIVLGGEIEVTEESRDHMVKSARQGRGQFAGELNLLTGQRPFHTARATADSEILVIPPAQLRVLLSRETEIADMLVKTLIARRYHRISANGSTAPIEIIGAGRSAQALALRTFLGRNTVPHRWVDTTRQTVWMTTSAAPASPARTCRS